MPSDKKSTKWMIGFNLIPGVDEGRVKEYCAQLPALICTREVGENEKPHVHILAQFDPPASKQTLSNRIRRFFPDAMFGKADLYLKEWLDVGLCRYVCKGPSKSVQSAPDVVFTTWTDEEVSSYHSAYWEQNATLPKKSTKKEPSKYADDLCQEIADSIKHKYVANPDRTIRECHEEICQLLMAKKKGRMSDNVAFPYVQSILYQIYPRWTEADFTDRMKRKFNSLF